MSSDVRWPVAIQRIWLYAFDYCIDRSTAAVMDFCMEFGKRLGAFDDFALEYVIREIDRGTFRFDCDKAEWIALKEKLVKELERRKNE